MKTQRLELTEAQAMDFKMVKDRGYPKMPEITALVLNMVADNLCISHQAIQWAFHDGTRGNDEGWRRLRERLLSKPVKLVKE